MIDISKNIGKYTHVLDNVHINFLKPEVEEKGIHNAIKFIIDLIDCTIIWKDDKTYVQTISWLYRHRISQLIYLIENYGLTEKEQNAYYNKIIGIHINNLEYEKLHPPVIYDKNKTKTKTKRKNIKHTQTVIEGFDKPKKQSVAERKLTAKVAKLNNLSINIKPIK